ncbi:alginate O-acetyltransferase AlgF [Pseudomonas sp. 5Ae-yellow]|uniref:alginate O-acetyltransferase AlgF n=1 Tax=Pseudomonas sp. 5Ae-yellow TaxID=2759848 RepID=UPI002175543E|nr:alginate O-acetyltransferase AlgF [Pseudomonas sp. 5Ae-yellow]|tara:strand:- start:4857 stop:5507 length:651 start_codon:yes stop_codon:yes gene_type:complete
MMRATRCFAALLMLWAGFGCANALAQDANADLYDAVAPANSAFIRLMNLSDAGVEVTLTSKTSAQRVGASQFGGYRFVEPGTHRIGVAGQALEVELKANTASTVLYRNGELELLTDDVVNEPARAQIVFYNLTDTDAALTTVDGKTPVVDSRPPFQNGSRMVNEVKIAFAAYAGERNLVAYPEQLLRKGRSYSYALLPEGGGYRGLAVANSIDASQ